MKWWLAPVVPKTGFLRSSERCYRSWAPCRRPPQTRAPSAAGKSSASCRRARALSRPEIGRWAQHRTSEARSRHYRSSSLPFFSTTRNWKVCLSRELPKWFCFTVDSWHCGVTLLALLASEHLHQTPVKAWEAKLAKLWRQQQETNVAKTIGFDHLFIPCRGRPNRSSHYKWWVEVILGRSKSNLSQRWSFSVGFNNEENFVEGGERDFFFSNKVSS